MFLNTNAQYSYNTFLSKFSNQQTSTTPALSKESKCSHLTRLKPVLCREAVASSRFKACVKKRCLQESGQHLGAIASEAEFDDTLFAGRSHRENGRIRRAAGSDLTSLV